VNKEYTEPAVHTLDYVENDENDTGKEMNKEYTEFAVHTLDHVENDENDTGKEVYKEYTEPAVHTLYYFMLQNNAELLLAQPESRLGLTGEPSRLVSKHFSHDLWKEAYLA